MFRVLQNKKLAATLIPLRYAPVSLPCLVVSLGGEIWWLIRFFSWLSIEAWGYSRYGVLSVVDVSRNTVA
jgi:hypothetical protein